MQKNAFWMRISEWSSDVCLFDLLEFIDGIGYNINRPRNVGEAKLKGVEVSGQTFFDFLPGALSGFGVSGNFTRSEEHTSELQSLMRISYAVFCLKKKNKKQRNNIATQIRPSS